MDDSYCYTKWNFLLGSTAVLYIFSLQNKFILNDHSFTNT